MKIKHDGIRVLRVMHQSTGALIITDQNQNHREIRAFKVQKQEENKEQEGRIS